MGADIGLTEVVDDVVAHHVLPFLAEDEGRAAAKAVLGRKPRTFTMRKQGDFIEVDGDWDAFMIRFGNITPKCIVPRRSIICFIQ